MGENGVKFRTEFASGILPSDSRIAGAISAAKAASNAGLVPSYGSGSHGNISFRVGDDSFIITGTGTDMAKLKEGDFVLVESCDIKKNTVRASGAMEPSSESIVNPIF